LGRGELGDLLVQLRTAPPRVARLPDTHGESPPHVGSHGASLAPDIFHFAAVPLVEHMERSRAVVERLAAGDAAVYGVNTGVGLLADVRIAASDLDRLQRNVVRSHSAGVGDPLARAEVRAMMLIRANVLAKGFSGIRPVVAQRCATC
jgi:hypothetical protein